MLIRKRKGDLITCKGEVFFRVQEMSEKEQDRKSHCDLENFVIVSKYVVVLLLNDHISSQCLVIQEITIFRFLNITRKFFNKCQVIGQKSDSNQH